LLYQFSHVGTKLTRYDSRNAVYFFTVVTTTRVPYHCTKRNDRDIEAGVEKRRTVAMPTKVPTPPSEMLVWELAKLRTSSGPRVAATVCMHARNSATSVDTAATPPQGREGSTTGSGC